MVHAPRGQHDTRTCFAQPGDDARRFEKQKNQKNMKIAEYSLAIVLASALSQTILAKLCTVRLSTAGYRERQGDAVYREINIAADYKPTSEDAKTIEKLKGAQLVITGLNREHDPPLPHVLNDYQPAYSHSIQLSDDEIQTGTQKTVPFGPEQQMTFSYIQSDYGFKAQVILPNGRVACQDEWTDSVRSLRDTRDHRKDASTHFPSDNFFLGEDEQPYTPEEIRRMSNAVTAIESIQSKQTGYQPTESALNPDETAPVEMVNNLMNRIQGVYANAMGPDSEKTVRSPMTAPAQMTNAHEIFEPFMKHNRKSGSYLRRVCRVAPWLLTGKSAWQSIFAPERAVQEHLKYLG